MQHLTILAIFLLAFSTNLTASLEKFFKKAENKSDIHRLPNIDFIYMINLDKRPEKYKASLEALASYNIIPYRFSAVNGWELDISTINQLGVIYNSNMNFKGIGTTYQHKKGKELINFYEPITKPGTCYFAHCITKGMIGATLSHLSVLQDALDSAYETIWVMEDDIEVIKDPNLLPYLIEKLDELDKDWDILFTDSETRAPDGNTVRVCASCPRPNFQIMPTKYYCYRKKINKDFTLKKARYGTYSMIVRKSGMKKILDFYKKYKIFGAYDIDCFYAPNLRVYTCNNPVVSTKIDALSDNVSAGYMSDN